MNNWDEVNAAVNGLSDEEKGQLQELLNPIAPDNDPSVFDMLAGEKDEFDSAMVQFDQEQKEEFCKVLTDNDMIEVTE